MSRTNSVCPLIEDDDSSKKSSSGTPPSNAYEMTTPNGRSSANTTQDIVITRKKSTPTDSLPGYVNIENGRKGTSDNDDDIQLTFYEAMSPLFNFMQIMGLWHGEVINPPKVKTKTRKFFNYRNYSILVLIFLWINFIRFVPAFFIGPELDPDRLYFKIIYLTVLLQAALNASVFFWAASSKSMLREYFVHFEKNIQMDSENRIDLVWLRKRCKIFTGIAITYITFHFLNQTVGVFGPIESVRNSTNIFIAPFDPHPALHVACVFLNVFDFAAWIFPLLYFLLTCVLMSRLFSSFDDRFGDEIDKAAVSKIFPPGFEKLRRQHQALCDSVESGNDGAFMYINLITYLTMGPLACFMLYQLVFASNIQGNLSAYLMYTIWLTSIFFNICVVSWFAAVMSSKVIPQRRFHHQQL